MLILSPVSCIFAYDAGSPLQKEINCSLSSIDLEYIVQGLQKSISKGLSLTFLSLNFIFNMAQAF